MTGAAENELLLLVATLVGFALYLIRAYRRRSPPASSGRRNDAKNAASGQPDGIGLFWNRFPDANQILATATVILVVIGYFALKDTEATLEFSERAWVGPIDAKLDAAPQEGKEVKATVSVRNTGREPALDFVWNLKALIATATELESGVIDKMASAYVATCFKAPSRRRQQVVYPSTGFGTGFDFSSTIDKDLIDNHVIDGDNLIMVQGCLVYRTFDKVRHSAFCYFFKAKTSDPAHLNICAGGSDAD
jgi:hypothetical protein